MREIKKILVLGLGTMGNGIAHVAAQGGYEVVAYDIKQEFLDRGVATIRKNLSRGLKKGKITEEEIEKIMARISTSTDLEKAAEGVDFVIEAVYENLEVKVDLFQRLNKVLPEDVIFASNTSSISISLLAGSSGRPERFIGMHFFNPVPVMKLVEIIRGILTTDETYEVTKQIAEKMGKETIVAKDSPGFVVNRILVPMLNEAVFAYSEGLATAEDIDKGMVLGTNMPIGPLALLDLIGLDTALMVSDEFYKQFQDSKYRVPPLMRQMVASGLLGRKSGRGFYKYD
ncbi:MAG: 3-hydroxybutyryl-CoA dehydrogenase [Methanobacteriota archaeon]|nr:MAG: 3-hydroxybutyryl-CoA dehydrogenase [Euryarchaeota archaeon]